MPVRQHDMFFARALLKMSFDFLIPCCTPVNLTDQATLKFIGRLEPDAMFQRATSVMRVGESLQPVASHTRCVPCGG
jgi:hypothetical protein